MILMVAVIATGVILYRVDSGTVSAGVTTSADAEPTAQPSASAAPVATAAAPAVPSLPPETVTTVTRASPRPRPGAGPPRRSGARRGIRRRRWP